MSRVKLCAIAKDEGAYLADWVFHHLHFGYDGIAVWVNGTTDRSVDVLDAVSAVHPEVEHRVVDGLLERTLAKGKSFQFAAYARLAKRAAAQGYTHAAFLDLDEYWTPADLRTPVHDFLTDDVETNVVSFPWCTDLPDPQRRPFAHPLDGPVLLQRDVHVKSVVRLDDRVRQVRTHTARTSAGRRLLVRDPFPLVDERAQQWGSVTPLEHQAEHGSTLPEAFVLHAMHRSPREYVASLAGGLRQTGADLPYKTNRHGFVPSSAPVLELPTESAAMAAYARERTAFRRRVGVDDLVRECEDQASARAEGLLTRLREDAELLAVLRGALHGISDPDLDRLHPGWDAGVRMSVDTTLVIDGRLHLVGWAFATGPGDGVELALRDPDGEAWTGLACTRVERPDVARLHRAAAPHSGFRLEVPPALVDRLADCSLLARASGSTHWDQVPLRRLRRHH